MQTGITDITACDDAAECKSVDNIISIITHYHYWNEEQCNKNPDHETIDYSALYIDENEQDYNELVGNGLTSLTSSSSLSPKNNNNKSKTIHPQLTKSSASIRNLTKYGNIISEFMDNGDYTQIELLNDFDHIIDKHCNNYREFDFIYNELTKENEIKIKINKSNNILHRHNYSRDILYKDIELMKKLYYGYYESQEIHQFEILDKIYIHFLFSYKFGFRLEPSQILEIESEEEQRLKLEEKSDKDPEINIDKSLGAISEKLTFLRMNLTKYDTFKSRFNKSNRFVTNYNNAMLLNAEFNEELEIKMNIDDDDSKSATKSTTNTRNKPQLNNKRSATKSNTNNNAKANRMEMESLQQLATVQGMIYHVIIHYIFVQG